MDRLARLEIAKDLVQETVDRAVAAVEAVHQAISGVPFDVLEAFGVPDPLGLRVRQRALLGAVYGAVRAVNRHVGDLLSDQFEAVEDGRRVSRLLGAGGSVSGAAAARGRPLPGRRGPAAPPR